MKKVLLTNNYMMNFTGSELDTLTISEYLLENGYDVTIFTLEYGYPLLEKINKKIKLIDYDNRDLLEKDYDLLWAHHYPLVDYLLFEKRIKFSYIHYVSLSSFLGVEAPPIYYDKINLLSILSEDGKEKLTKDNFDTKNVNIFCNYSFEKYFKKSRKKSVSKPKKVCIVSNHIPTELLDFRNIATENNIVVDIYGIGYKYVKINDLILSNYDLVISIGKTLNYSLSLGIPSYCYDHFGGDLYITKDNFYNSMYYTFSGKYLKKKMSGEEIYNDIIERYSTVNKQMDDIRQISYNTFCFEDMMKKTLKKIFSTKKLKMDEIINAHPILKRTGSLYVDDIGYKISLQKKYYGSLTQYQVYFDTGSGYSEDNSIKNFYYIDKEYLKTEIEIPGECKSIRFDFCEKEFMYLEKILINGKEYKYVNFLNCIKYKDGILSLTDDPYIIIELENLKCKKIKIEILLHKINSTDYITNLYGKSIALRNEINFIKNDTIFKKIKRKLKFNK